MKATVKDAPYTGSGLPNVVLKGIRVYVCSKCKEKLPEIPNLGQLHQVIAKALLTKDSLLMGPEIRFLRRHMGLKAKEFAELLGTTDVTVSRWETGSNDIDPKTDRLIRLLVVRKLEEETNTVLLRGLYRMLAEVRPSTSKPVSLLIPRSRLVRRPKEELASV
jgi:putative zinc finger/helix-turn-helix YgiT family protein